VALLPSGASYKNLGLATAEEMQLVTRFNYSVADVSRVFGVRPSLLSDPSRSTFALASAAMKAFTLNGDPAWDFAGGECRQRIQEHGDEPSQSKPSETSHCTRDKRLFDIFRSSAGSTPKASERRPTTLGLT
jgi:hypothetical protein